MGCLLIVLISLHVKNYFFVFYVSMPEDFFMLSGHRFIRLQAEIIILLPVTDLMLK